MLGGIDMQDTKTLHEITLPRLSEADEESLITFWHKSEKDRVKKGDILVEVQTEKAVTEIESDIDGVIVKIHKKRGEVIGAGEVLVSLAEEEKEESEPMTTQAPSNDASVPERHETQTTKPSFVKASPRVRKMAKDLGVDLANITGTGKKGELTIEDIQNAANEVRTIDAPTPNHPVERKRVIAAPSVRKLAREKGV